MSVSSSAILASAPDTGFEPTTGESALRVRANIISLRNSQRSVYKQLLVHPSWWMDASYHWLLLQQTPRPASQSICHYFTTTQPPLWNTHIHALTYFLALTLPPQCVGPHCFGACRIAVCSGEKVCVCAVRGGRVRVRGQRGSANEEKQHCLSRPPRSGSNAVARGRVSVKARGERSTSRPRAGPDLR